tara:strand:+ start:182 stop:1870 length:1689 start_codon:yes stop_codon:yes gene_type:complete
MCGINGITKPNQESRVRKMMEYTHRRGPDGSDIKSNDYVTFGHNLLAIFSDIDSSVQPYEYNNSLLIFNGAIYNYEELDEWNCKSGTDTEVLIKGLYHYGIEFMQRCEGMWAFGFHKNGVTTICRDHFGIKPLYYRHNGDELIFSSSIHALEIENKKLDSYAFSLFNTFGYVPGYLTLIRDCYKLCPGEYVSYTSEGLHSGNLWSIHRFGNKKYTKQEFNDRLQLAITKSRVGIRQRGVFLSGGLDSTSVAHYLNEKNTFTNKYETNTPAVNDDADVAFLMADDYDFNHEEVIITPQNFYDSIDESLLSIELPVFNKSTPAYFYMNKVMRDKGTIVTYSGDGGDEMYTGYAIHGQYGKSKDPILDHFLTCGWKKGKSLKLNYDQLYLTSQSYLEYMHNWFPKNVFGDDHINNCLFVEMLTRVAEDFLTRNDKFGSYFGMEGRFPLLNLPFYNYIMSIPSDVKLTNLDETNFKPGEYKMLARDGLKDILPKYVIEKGKSGWTIPDAEWRKEEEKFITKMNKLINEPLNNKLDDLIDWSASRGPKTFYAATFFKQWLKKYNISL